MFKAPHSQNETGSSLLIYLVPPVIFPSLVAVSTLLGLLFEKPGKEVKVGIAIVGIPLCYVIFLIVNLIQIRLELKSRLSKLRAAFLGTLAYALFASLLFTIWVAISPPSGGVTWMNVAYLVMHLSFVLTVALVMAASRYLYERWTARH